MLLLNYTTAYKKKKSKNKFIHRAPSPDSHNLHWTRATNNDYMYESHKEDTSKKMCHLPCGLLLSVLCFNSSDTVLNKTPTTLDLRS